MHSTRRMNRPFVLLLLAFTDTHLNTVIGNTPRTCKFQQRGKTDGVFLLGSQRANASFKPSVKLPMMPGGKLALSVNRLVQREDQMQCSPTRLLQHTGSICLHQRRTLVFNFSPITQYAVKRSAVIGCGYLSEKCCRLKLLPFVSSP